MGDYRLLYLPWLYDAVLEIFEDDETEPMRGIGPLTRSLRDAAEFFGLPEDLVEVAAEHPDPALAMPDGATIRAAITTLSDAEKIALLTRVPSGDRRVDLELRGFARKMQGAAQPATEPQLRTVKELRAVLGPTGDE